MDLRQLARNSKSATRARQRVIRSGFTMSGDEVWTQAQRELVRLHSPNYDHLCKLLPNRSRKAIRWQASAMGVARPKHIYTAAQIAKLRNMFKRVSWPELLEAFPFTTPQKLKAVAAYYGLYRPRRPYKLTGIPGLDEVRQRCFEIGWTMPDLDKMARTRSYFSKAGWIGKKINHRALGRAIEALDGVVRAQWKEE